MLTHLNRERNKREGFGYVIIFISGVAMCSLVKRNVKGAKVGRFYLNRSLLDRDIEQ